MKHRVEIKYCKNVECQGHKGPNDVHAHINLYEEGVAEPVESPAFGSRKAGTAMSLMVDEAQASEEEKILSSLISSTVASADLPETYGDDDKFVESCKIAQKMRSIMDVILIIGGPGHERINRMIDHNQHTIVLTGCLGCGATMGIYHGDRLKGSAEGVCTVDDAKYVLDQAQTKENFNLSADDVAGLREKIPALFKA